MQYIRTLFERIAVFVLVITFRAPLEGSILCSFLPHFLHRRQKFVRRRCAFIRLIIGHKPLESRSSRYTWLKVTDALVCNSNGNWESPGL